MSEIDMVDLPARELPFPDKFAVSCAGANPVQEGLCFGSEDGLLQLFDADFRPLGGAVPLSPSGEAINSVVGFGDWIVASTRREIGFLARHATNGKLHRAKTEMGAHQLAVLTNGVLVAALGRMGVMFSRPGAKTEPPFILDGTLNGSDVNVYRIAALPDAGFVAAVRSGGILYGQAATTEPMLNVLSFSGFDVVDVCAIGTAQHPLAVAAIAKDGTLILSKDIVNDVNPRTFGFASVQGVAYRLASHQGHLIVLTDKYLCFVWEVAEQFLEGALNFNDASSLLIVPTTAVDLNLVQNRIVVVELNCVRVIDVEAVRKHKPNGKREKPQAYATVWKREEVNLRTQDFAIA